MASRANSFYRCPSNNEATNSFAFPVNEVLSARLPRHAQHAQPGTPERAGSPVSRRNVADRRTIPAFPRAYSEVITHEIIPQVSFHFHPTRLRGHSPELRKARHLETRTRTVSVSPLPRAVSAVTWCNSGHFQQRNPTLLTSSPQRENGKEDSKSRQRQTFPQAPRAVVVQSRKTQAASRGQGAAPHSPRPQRIIASPRANLNQSAPSTATTSTFSSLVGCGAPERKAPAPIGAQPLSVRATGHSASRGSGPSFTERTPAQEAPEISYPSSDLDGLLRYLRDLDQKGLRMTEAVYSVNSWMLYGLIPLRHHGLILYSEGSRSCGKDPYLTLDFSSRGILWDTFDVYPDVPEGTFFSKTYKINMDPLVLRDYCKATQPFSWPDNDCKHWAKGVLLLMGIPDDPCADGAVDGISRRGQVGLREIITCGASHNSNRVVGCMP